MITGFVPDDRQSFETVLKVHEVKYDEEGLSNEERYEVLKKKELIDELLYGGTQSIGVDLKMKEEKEMYKDISIGKNQNFFLMKEKVEQSPWTIMKYEGKEEVLSKSRQQNIILL